MQLTLRQAADKLGKSIRQVRYMIQLGQLAATKFGGEWHIDVAALPTTTARSRPPSTTTRSCAPRSRTLVSYQGLARFG